MTELRKLVDFVYELKWEDIPENVKNATRNVVFDTVGVGIGACHNDQNVNIIKTFKEIDEGTGNTQIWGRKEKMSLLNAIYINGMEGHTLEMDDVHTRSKVHIGTVVVPVAWSMCEFYQKSGKELLLSILCGYEVAARIGMALGVSSHRNLGWHATATAGIFGAAVAAGKILGLTPDQLVNALGMAGQISGGTWAFLGDGASCKVMNPAMAAVNGTKCAYNAKAGMTGPENVLTVKDGGMLAAMSDEYDVSKVSANLGTSWEIMMMDNKPYPCCRSTHCAIDGAIELKDKYHIHPEDIESIKVYTYLIGNKQCGMSEPSKHPTIPVEAKFSTPFTVANAVLYGKVGLNEFEQNNIDDVTVQNMLKKVTVITDETFTEKYPDHWGCKVVIKLNDGNIYETTIPDASGSVENPLTEQQLVRKITGILERVKPESEVTEILNRLLNIESATSIYSI